MAAKQKQVPPAQRTLLGVVDQNGVERFESRDINECRQYLYDRGFTCSRSGWETPDRFASLTYWEGSFHVAIMQG